MTGNPEDNSLERLAPVELAAFRLVKLEKPERSLFCNLREDFMGHVSAVDFDCLEYKNNPEPGREWLPSRRCFYIGMFKGHGCYLNVNGADYHYCDILRNFGDILTELSPEDSNPLGWNSKGAKKHGLIKIQ